MNNEYLPDFRRRLKFLSGPCCPSPRVESNPFLNPTSDTSVWDLPTATCIQTNYQQTILSYDRYFRKDKLTKD